MRYADIRKRAVRLIAAACLLAAAGGDAAAAPLGKRIELGNGMVLLLAERHDLPLVNVTLAVGAGALAAPKDKPGLAGITASLMMQGTKSRSANQISREIDFVGGSLSVAGGDDLATVTLRVLKKDIGKGFELLSDVLLRPVFDQQEIDRKVKEVLAEIRRQKDEPESVAGEAFSKAVFGDHPYGRTNDEAAAYLAGAIRDDIVAFHAAHYTPDNTIMAVAGDVTEKEVRRLLGKYFKGWTSKARPAAPAPATPVRTAAEVIRLNKGITQANIAIGEVGISRDNPDFYAVSVMNFILGGGGFSSRLMDNIRDNKGLAYDVHSMFAAGKQAGAFRVWVQTKNESANDAIAEILKELERMRREPVSDRELADAKAYLTGSFPLRMDTSAKIAGILTSIELFGLGLDYHERYPRLINAVAKEDVLRVAGKYLHPERMVIVVLGDQEKIKLKYE